jgi:molybdopterin converting factor small subunit
MKVLLPTPLTDYTAGAREVTAAGMTLDAVLLDLDRQFPGIRFRMIDEQNQVRAHIKLFVNRQLERNLQRPLDPSDELLVVAALSGG